MVTQFLHTLVIFFMSSVCYGQGPSPCPSSRWTVVGEDTKCVRFVDNFRLTAGQARNWCASRGAALLRFSNYDSMMSFSQAATIRKTDGWWSDLSDVGQPGTWTWGGNEKITPGALAWATEPTDTHHVENCVSMDSTGSLNDDDCTQRIGYICSYTPATAGTCGGEFQSAGMRCYYVSLLDDPAEKMSWSAARNACLTQAPADGVTPVLASFTSADQLQGLQQMVQIASTQGKRWVGLNDRSTEREWAWADATRVSDTSIFNNQWKHYPDRGTGHSCGLVHSNGQMEEADCTDKHHFACQINNSPDSFVLVNGLGCPSPWIRGGNKCYFFDRRHALTHDKTQQFCSRMQGSLLKIESSDERDWVLQQTISGHMFNMWTGLKRASDASPTWVWDDGTPADTTLYAWNQQPSNPVFRDADCAFVNHRGKYNDASCFLQLSFICEMDTEDVPCPKNWLSDDNNDMTTCYYVSTNATDGKASWQEALNRCRQLAGLPDAHLVAINSQSEMDYMMSLMSTNPYDVYWTDLTDKEIEGAWSFSQQYEGTPPPIPWDQEPNNGGGHENCAVLFVGGKYNDVSCSRSAHVICERPAAGVHLNSGSSTTLHSGFLFCLGLSKANQYLFLPLFVIISMLCQRFCSFG
ncbi:macrophage mannose receptor 1-like isoform X2 [Littorina saxatilis]|uniref:C-type lectin domain-containing protein n=1 Tax=Littorina saxatilis TaxID=31220 RepID=A0AAN9BTU1_9CAEN